MAIIYLCHKLQK